MKQNLDNSPEEKDPLIDKDDLNSDLQSNVSGEVELEKNLSAPAQTSEVQSSHPVQSNSLDQSQTASEPVNNITQASQNQEFTPVPDTSAMPPVQSKKKIWLWIILVIFFLLLLSFGSLVFASWRGWISLGLGEFFGGISGNPHKAVLQTVNKINEIEKFEYNGSLDFKVRYAGELTQKNKVQKSLSSATTSLFKEILNFPNKLDFGFDSSKVLGEFTNKTSINFQYNFSGKITDKALSMQYKVKLLNTPSMEMYKPYLEPYANSNNEIILDSIIDTEKNYLYFKISSLEKVEENPWIKFDSSQYITQESLDETIQKKLSKLEELKIKNYQNLFKKAKNLGIEKINNHYTYHFVYTTNMQKLIEFYQEIDDSAIDNIYNEQDFDIEIDLWLGVFDQFTYKCAINFATQESNAGSVVLDADVLFDYQDISVDIPDDSESVEHVCESALKDKGIIKEICENPAYRGQLDQYFSSTTSQDTALARDKQRKSDLRTLQAAIEMYREDQGNYPISIQVSKTNDENSQIVQALRNYLADIPVDPADPNYYYGYRSDENGVKYVLTCILENPDNPEDYEKLNGVYLYQLGNL